jgi:hypothetical protein
MCTLELVQCGFVVAVHFLQVLCTFACEVLLVSVKDLDLHCCLLLRLLLELLLSAAAAASSSTPAADAYALDGTLRMSATTVLYDNHSARCVASSATIASYSCCVCCGSSALPSRPRAAT